MVQVNERGIENWLRDIAIPTIPIEDQLGMLRRPLKCLRQGRLTFNREKSQFCQTVIELVGTIVDRFGTRPAPGKIDAITQPLRPEKVKDMRVLLGMTGFLHEYAPNYSTESRGTHLAFADRSEI